MRGRFFAKKLKSDLLHSSQVQFLSNQKAFWHVLLAIYIKIMWLPSDMANASWPLWHLCASVVLKIKVIHFEVKKEYRKPQAFGSALGGTSQSSGGFHLRALVSSSGHVLPSRCLSRKGGQWEENKQIFNKQCWHLYHIDLLQKDNHSNMCYQADVPESLYNCRFPLSSPVVCNIHLFRSDQKITNNCRH